MAIARHTHQRTSSADAVADVAKDDAAQRSHEEGTAKDSKRLHQRRGRVVGREEEQAEIRRKRAYQTEATSWSVSGLLVRAGLRAWR